MTPLTLFVSVLLYMAAILCPGAKPNEKETSQLPKVGQEIQKSGQQSTQEKHTEL